VPLRSAPALTILAATLIASAASAITPPPLELTEFAREPLVRNAVAITVDEHNRVYVTSVVRRQAADLDIRRFREWIETDLSLTSNRAKEAWFREELIPANSSRYANRFEDTNGDGSFDWRDLDLLPDQITLFKDHEGDGTADDALKFNAAENTIVTGIAAGIAAWDGAVYATIEPDLVKLTDTTGDGILNHRQVLATGFSLHIGYGGHNFSGPIVGPDGRIYAAVADRGMNVTTADGKNFYNPHSGAVVRMELDGANFEMFATGLRNVHEPAFDAYGNLLGVDNDGDFSTEKERFVYITEGSDTGWRTNWQYRGEDWLPWMDEGLSIPAHPGQPTYLTPPIQNYLDGPAGFVFNPGTAFSPAYRDFFFLARFPARDIYAFRSEIDGAGVKMSDSHQVHEGILAVGLEFGATGELYLADWSSSGYDMNEDGAVWKLDDPTDTNSALRQTTAALLARDWHLPSLAELRLQLANPDQRVRMKAQFELVRRSTPAVLQAAASDHSADQLSRLHAIWGLGQILRQSASASVSEDSLLALLAANDDEVRAQTAKVIGEAQAPSARLTAGLIPLLRDTSDRPRFFASIALGRLQLSSARPEILAYLERDGGDTFHRHAAVMGLVGTTPASALAALHTHEITHVRLNAIVALRRLASPLVTKFLADKDPLVVAEAASAIHDDESIQDALPALAAILVTQPGTHERAIRRALGAALRLRQPKHAAQVAQYAANHSVPTALRLHAISILQQWPAPANLDTVEGRFRPLAPVTPASITAAVETTLRQLSQSPDYALAAAAWAASDVFNLAPATAELLAIIKQDSPIATEALRSFPRTPSPELNQAIKLALKSQHAATRAEALNALHDQSLEEFLIAAKPALNRTNFMEPRAVIKLLAGATAPEKRQLLLGQVERLRDGSLNPALALDVVQAAAGTTDPKISSAITAYEKSKDLANPLSPYTETLLGGNPIRGQSVFETSVVAQCTLCHRVGRIGSRVGPRLNKIGLQTPEYILEALVNPGAVVADGYGVTTVSLHDGSAISGTLLKETKSTTSLKLSDGATRDIPRSEIASRTPALSAMPPMGVLISKSELRDLNAYLQSLK
jgi:quinoprotein glucose dehydrogenase